MTEERKQEGMSDASEALSEEEAAALDPENATAEEWRALVARKDGKIAELQERVLRIAADAENTRKRLERDKQEGICFANESLIRSLLPVVDNLERAVEHAENGSDAEPLVEGVRMTLKGFTDALGRFGCQSFDSAGKPFDPRFHEAMMQEESSEHEANTVIREMEKGYVLNDRLIRPAKVVVSRLPAGGEGSEGGSGPTEEPPGQGGGKAGASVDREI